MSYFSELGLIIIMKYEEKHAKEYDVSKMIGKVSDGI
jgi:hypothetical protein